MTGQLRGQLGSCTALMALALLVANAARADDQDRMQGTWKAVSAKAGNKVATKQQLRSIRIIIQGDKFTLVEGPKKIPVTILVDSKANPPTIDFFKDKKKKVRYWKGIYSLEDGELKLCWGNDRPSEFDANGRNNFRCYTFRKD